MPIPKDNPAELEARLLSSIAALRRIRDALDSALANSPRPMKGLNPPAEVLHACSTLCASYAGSVLDEITS